MSCFVVYRGNIKYLAVARASDQVIVASFVAFKNDANLSQYQNSVKEVLNAPDFQYKVTQGSRYRLVGEVNAFNFTVDQQQLVYICITAINFPERMIFPMLNELAPKFKKELGEKALQCNPDELSRKAEGIFSAMVTEFDDPTKKDKLSSVMSKVEDVKLTMHNNIDGMLRSLDQSEQVERTTAKLHEQARLFDNQARTIKRQEQWKNMKMSLLIGGVVLLIVILLISMFR